MKSAAPIPWRTRAAMSQPMSGAATHIAEAAVKTTSPAVNNRRAEAVAQASGQKQQAGERQRVPIDDPGEAGCVGVQVRADAGKGDVAGGDVEQCHAQTEAAGDEGESGVGMWPGHACLRAGPPG